MDTAETGGGWGARPSLQWEMFRSFCPLVPLCERHLQGYCVNRTLRYFCEYRLQKSTGKTVFFPTFLVCLWLLFGLRKLGYVFNFESFLSFRHFLAWISIGNFIKFNEDFSVTFYFVSLSFTAYVNYMSNGPFIGTKILNNVMYYKDHIMWTEYHATFFNSLPFD